MTTKLTIYKSLLRDEVLVEDVTKETNLSKAIYARRELRGLYASAWVNDILIPPDDWHLFELNQFDQIHLIGQPQKGSLPIIGAVIGAVVMTVIFPPGAGSYWTLAAAAIKGAAIGYSIGALADSLIFPPTIPNVNTESQNPNYGWDGARLVTQPDGPISVIYGQHRVSGTLIMQYVTTDGAKNYLHMLINLGEGPISGIMKSDGSGVCAATTDTPDVEINGQAYSTYENCTWDYRLGEWDQTIIAGFHGTKTYYSDGRKVANGTPITYTTTGIDITTFNAQLHCATLFTQNDNGDIVENAVRFQLEYQVVGAGSWTDGGAFTITGKSKTIIYNYQSVTGLTAGQYNIRITRLTPDFTSFKQGGDLYITGVTEQTDEDIAYRNSALLALHIQATDQLSGTTPNITAEIRGKVVSVPKLTIAAATQTYDDCYWDGTSTYKRTSDNATCTDSGTYVNQWSRNPIWCTRDFLLNSRYGTGNYIDSDSFDTTSAATEAKYCWEQVTDFEGGNEHRFEMDMPISTVMSAPEAVKMLARTFRGWVIWSNGTYKPVIDRDKDPVWLFNSSNLFPKTLKTTYFKASGIPNVVEIQYADKDRDYNINTPEVVDEDEWTSTKPLRKLTISAIGTVRTSQNLRDGKYYLNCGLYCTKAVEFEVPEHLLHVEPGDIVRIQDDLLAWGVGGRIVSATSSSITTNIDVTYTASYEVRVRLPDNSLETKTVTSITNNNRTLNISGTFTATPLTDSVFTYGAASADSKPFKVKTITRTSEGNYKLLVSEESANKYSDTSNVSLPEPKYTSLPNPTDPPDNIEDLALTEMANQPGFYISFNIPQGDINFHHVDFLLSLDESNYWAYRTGVTTNSDIEVPNTKPGVTYYVKAISYNHKGVANFSPATDSITTMDTNFKPPQVNGLRLDGEATLNSITFTKKDAKFTWVKTSVTLGAGHLPAGQEALGAAQFFEEESFRYWVEIWVSDALVRKEIINENRYVYTYEKNLADNDGTPSTSLTIKVWGFNEHGNLRSDYSTDLVVSNPSPAVVTSLTVTGTSSTTEFVGKDVNVSWTAPTDPDILNYKVIITKSDDTVLRTEYVTDRQYTYAFNMNADDNSDVALNAVKVLVYSQDWFSQLSSVTTISVTNPVPADVSDLTATAYPRGVNFEWSRNTEPDLDYYKYRIQVESDGWSSWVNTKTYYILRILTETEISDHTSAAAIYIEVKAVDTFGNESASAASANATTVTMDIAATDIDDFAITASKNFTKIPVLESDSWTNDSPGAGSVAWNEHSLFYNGAEYTIAAGNTALKYIYWLNGLSIYDSSNTNPTLTDDDFIIAVNESGTHDLAWNAIANQVIGSAYIENASIIDAHIDNVAANKIVADQLSAISANLGSITSGYIDSVEIVSSTFQTSTSGKRIEITSDGITLHITDATGKYGTNFKYGDGTKYGAGILAYIQHNTQAVPFYVQAEQTVADFHYFNRSSNPSGAAEIGDTAVVDGIFKICTADGTPGTWTDTVKTGWYNVLDYGANNGGSVECSAEIQAAIDAGGANSVIFFPAGTYLIDTALSMTNGAVRLTGVGRYQSKILSTTNQTMISWDCTSATLYYMEISDIGIQNSCSGTRTSVFGISLAGSNSIARSTIRNVAFIGTYVGIHSTNTNHEWITITENIFENTGGNTNEYGIYFDGAGAAGQANIINNIFHTDTTGIFMRAGNGEGFGDFTIAGNNFDGGTYSIFLQKNHAGVTYAANFNITGNKFDNVTTPVHIDGASGFRVLGNSYLGGTTTVVLASTITAPSNYVIDYENTAETGGFDMDGSLQVTKDLATKTGVQAHLVLRENTVKTKMLALGFDSDDEGWIQAVDYGIGALPLILQPNGGGVQIGSPTGGDKGNGTLNATAVYDDNVLLGPDHAIESYVDGKIDYNKWDKLAKNKHERELRNELKGSRKDYIPTEKEEAQITEKLLSVQHEPAHRFDSELNFNIDNYGEFFKTNKHLPALPLVEDLIKDDNGLSLSDIIKRLWETCEVQAVHIDKLNQRLKYVEGGLNTMFHNDNKD